MSEYTIRIAHSKGKHGFTCYSHETIVSKWHGIQKSGLHIASAETLDEARAEIDARIRHDWFAIGKGIPPIVECGKVSQFNGLHSNY